MALRGSSPRGRLLSEKHALVQQHMEVRNGLVTEEDEWDSTMTRSC